MNVTGTWIRRGNTILIDLGAHAAEASEMETFEFESGTSGGRPVIRKGSRGAAVTELQSRLRALGYDPGPIDGIFGSQTDAAVKGFQRAKRIAVDGVVGPTTWGVLYGSSGGGSAPAPSPWPAPSPSPSPSPPAGGAAGRILAEARKHIGFREGPNNDNPFSAYFGVRNVAWCAYFVSYVYTKAGVPLKFGSCSLLLDYLIDNDKLFTTVPAPGDIVIFDWTLGDHDDAEHVGIVESVVTGSSGKLRVKTIEGNSSNGVNRREYDFGSGNIVGYGRLA